MKKILCVTTVSMTINTFLVPHIKMLIEEGNLVDVACSIDKEINKELVDMGSNIYEIPFSRNPINIKNITAYKEIKKLVKKNKYDIVHVHTPVASFVTRLSLRNEKIKMIYIAHGFHFYNGAPLLNWIIYYPLENLAAKWTDRIVTINSEDFNRAKKFKLRKNSDVHLIHGVGVDPNEYKLEDFNRNDYRKELGLDKEDFVILILSELNKNKNHIQIIEAMKILGNKYPKIKVICGGEGVLKEYLIKKVQSYGLSEKIKFIGFRNDIKELNTIADSVALFSKREGLGKCLLEGMIFDNFLMATKTRGPKELIENNKNGFLINIDDYEETAKVIENLYLNKNLYGEFLKESKLKIKKYYLSNVLIEIKKINTGL